MNGRLETAALGQLENELDGLLSGSACKVVLDCSSLSFAASASLVRLLKYALGFRQRHGQFALAGLAPEVRRVAHLTRLDSKFSIHADVPAALDAMGQADAREPRPVPSAAG